MECFHVTFRLWAYKCIRRYLWAVAVDTSLQGVCRMIYAALRLCVRACVHIWALTEAAPLLGGDLVEGSLLCLYSSATLTKSLPWSKQKAVIQRRELSVNITVMGREWSLSNRSSFDLCYIWNVRYIISFTIQPCHFCTCVRWWIIL